jgi:hypothetical protein
MPSNPSIIESTTRTGCSFQPAIHRVPSNLLDSGNRRFVQTFDTQGGNLVEGSSSVLEAVIDRATIPAEGFATTLISESATPTQPGTIETTANNAFGFGLIPKHGRVTRVVAGIGCVVNSLRNGNSEMSRSEAQTGKLMHLHHCLHFWGHATIITIL